MQLRILVSWIKGNQRQWSHRNCIGCLAVFVKFTGILAAEWDWGREGIKVTYPWRHRCQRSPSSWRNGGTLAPWSLALHPGWRWGCRWSTFAQHDSDESEGRRRNFVSTRDLAATLMFKSSNGSEHTYLFLNIVCQMRRMTLHPHAQQPHSSQDTWGHNAANVSISGIQSEVNKICPVLGDGFPASNTALQCVIVRVCVCVWGIIMLTCLLWDHKSWPS